MRKGDPDRRDQVCQVPGDEGLRTRWEHVQGEGRRRLGTGGPAGVTQLDNVEGGKPLGI